MEIVFANIYPEFGEHYPEVNRVVVDRCFENGWRRILIPAIVAHEITHLSDIVKRRWGWEELLANTVMAFSCPLLFVIVALMSLSPGRLKLYWKRYKEGK
jgi:hypothetical protein